MDTSLNVALRPPEGFRAVKYKHLRGAGMGKIKYLDEHEIVKLFKVIKDGKNVRDLLLFTFTLRYGLRITEAVNIQLEDFKPDIKTPLEVFISRVKDGISRHYVLHPQDAKLLRKWLKIRVAYSNSKGNPFLFITKRSMNGGMTDSMMKKSFRKYALTAGMDRIASNPHSLRHSCAIALLMNGQDVLFVKNFLGHRSLKSTMVYVELAPSQWKELSNSVIKTAFPI